MIVVYFHCISLVFSTVFPMYFSSLIIVAFVIVDHRWLLRIVWCSDCSSTMNFDLRQDRYLVYCQVFYVLSGSWIVSVSFQSSLIGATWCIFNNRWLLIIGYSIDRLDRSSIVSLSFHSSFIADCQFYHNCVYLLIVACSFSWCCCSCCCCYWSIPLCTVTDRYLCWL